MCRANIEHRTPKKKHRISNGTHMGQTRHESPASGRERAEIIDRYIAWMRNGYWKREGDGTVEQKGAPELEQESDSDEEHKRD